MVVVVSLMLVSNVCKLRSKKDLIIRLKTIIFIEKAWVPEPIRYQPLLLRLVGGLMVLVVPTCTTHTCTL